MEQLFKLPEHVQLSLQQDPSFYSMDVRENILQAKEDADYLGDVLLANENLIWHSVHKYVGNPDMIVKNNCIEKDDVLQLGRLGFIKSVHAFDVKRGVKFSSFAVTAIVREVRCFLRDSAAIIRPTRTANELIHRIKRMEQDLGYMPSIEDTAMLLDECEAKVTKALQVGQSVKYLDEPIKPSKQGDQDITLLDTIDGGAGIEDGIIDKMYVDDLLTAAKEKLNEKEINVLALRLDGFNQTQTARKEDISQMRVSRIMKKVTQLFHEEIRL